MNLMELRPCDNCKGKLIPQFYVLRTSLAMFTENANQVMGLSMQLGGHIKLAEVFAPTPEDAIIIAGEKEPELMTEIFLCQSCYLRKNFRIAELVEIAIKHKENTDRQKGLIE